MNEETRIINLDDNSYTENTRGAYPISFNKNIKMVKETLDSFVHKDADRARKVCEIDDEIDDLNQKIFDKLVTFMKESSDTVTHGTRLIACSKNLERVADHATNIAEQVIFMVQGRDIRHGR